MLGSSRTATPPVRAIGRGADTTSAEAGDRAPARRARVALAAGLVTMVVALGMVLSGSPTTVAATNGVPDKLVAGYLDGGEQLACQHGQTLPSGTDAVRVSLFATAGPAVGVRVLEGARVLAQGSRGAGWGIAETVTVPIERVARTIEAASVCVTLAVAAGPVQVNGVLVPTAAGGQIATPRLEYLRPGSGSWLSLIPTIARNMGVGRAPSGTWVAYLVLAAMLVVALLSTSLVLRELGEGRRPGHASTRAGLPGVPRAAWTCALVAVISAVCWSLLTPPFQAPDEPSHFAYVQWLAETGTLPSSSHDVFSPQEEAALRGLHQLQVQWHPEAHTISTPDERQQLSETLSAPLSPIGSGGAGVAAGQPSGYYALETIPYYLGAPGTLLDRLELMRLLSAAMAGIAALFTFLFVREALPRAPWAWSVGGLAAALTPLLGFTSGVVSPDSMLCAVCAAVCYCLARAFRRGLTRGLALALAALTALGLLTKLNFLGLLPGVMLGVVLCSMRRCGALDRQALRRVRPTLALGVAVALGTAFVYVFAVQGHVLERVSSDISDLRAQSPANALAYAWQLYLPRLPGMHSYFPGLSSIRQLWLARLVGDYGWLDTPFPAWVDSLGLIAFAAIGMLALRAAVTERRALLARAGELLTYLALGAGTLTLLGAYAYLGRDEGAGFIQPRYLLPLLPLAAALVALAVRGAGRRWGPAAGALAVTLFLAHDVFSQLQLVARFYG
jgi:Predicted membrane protein (DUF2142)